ncbi:MAG: hypothetical protein IKU20_06710 [Lachnospiraceae bacterium]|nr:hypothetical protein [Lachnospiraceae bacterium]
MGAENGEWIMHGLEWDDPLRIRSAQELINYVNEVGFLPLFKNEIDGFSVEEHTWPQGWWSGDPEQDPWEWREEIARSGKVAYGKFFDKKAGFISLEWLPHFANYRRDGYDFDARYEDGLASFRSKRIMDQFLEHEELYSNELKELAGFGKGGEKNFPGIVTDLQMQTYLTVKDFRQRKNKKGQQYGWSIAIYAMPEQIWGYELVTMAYKEKPEGSKERIKSRVKEVFPWADDRQINKIIK